MPKCMCLTLRQGLITALWFQVIFAGLSFLISMASTYQLSANSVQFIISSFGLYVVHRNLRFLVMLFSIMYGFVVAISLGIGIFFIQSSQFQDVVNYVTKKTLDANGLNQWRNGAYGLVGGFFLFQITVWIYITRYYIYVKSITCTEPAGLEREISYRK